MTRDHMGKSEFNTEARAALEDDIDRCPICDVPFKPEDVCADDITEGTCHAECLEGSPVVDLETGDEIPDGKISTYLYREVMAPRIFDESGKSAGFELTPEALVAALTIPPPQTQTRGAQDVLSERRRQLEIEDFNTDQDDHYTSGELAWAAVCYLQNSAVAGKMQGLGLLTAAQCDERGRSLPQPDAWPWDAEWWKPAGQRRDLVKAAALIIAEIERLDRNSCQQS